MPKQPTWVLIAFIATLVFGFLFLTRAYSGCTATVAGFTTCTAYEVAKDFKEVFGWAIAMYVAYIAASPVWKQLELMRVDNDISSIKFLEQDIEALKRLRFDAGRAFKPFVDYIQGQSQNDEEGAWIGSKLAAYEAMQKADDALVRICEILHPFEKALNEDFYDLIKKASELRNCLYEINETEYLGIEFPASEDQWAAAQEAELTAVAAIDAHIGAFHRSRSQFDAAITNAIAARTRLISEKKTAMVSSR